MTPYSREINISKIILQRLLKISLLFAILTMNSGCKILSQDAAAPSQGQTVLQLDPAAQTNPTLDPNNPVSEAPRNLPTIRISDYKHYFKFRDLRFELPEVSHQVQSDLSLLVTQRGRISFDPRLFIETNSHTTEISNTYKKLRIRGFLLDGRFDSTDYKSRLITSFDFVTSLEDGSIVAPISWTYKTSQLRSRSGNNQLFLEVLPPENISNYIPKLYSGILPPWENSSTFSMMLSDLTYTKLYNQVKEEILEGEAEELSSLNSPAASNLANFKQQYMGKLIDWKYQSSQFKNRSKYSDAQLNNLISKNDIENSALAFQLRNFCEYYFKHVSANTPWFDKLMPEAWSYHPEEGLLAKCLAQPAKFLVISKLRFVTKIHSSSLARELADFNMPIQVSSGHVKNISAEESRNNTESRSRTNSFRAGVRADASTPISGVVGVGASAGYDYSWAFANSYARAMSLSSGESSNYTGLHIVNQNFTVNKLVMNINADADECLIITRSEGPLVTRFARAQEVILSTPILVCNNVPKKNQFEESYYYVQQQMTANTLAFSNSRMFNALPVAFLIRGDTKWMEFLKYTTDKTKFFSFFNFIGQMSHEMRQDLLRKNFNKPKDFVFTGAATPESQNETYPGLLISPVATPEIKLDCPDNSKREMCLGYWNQK